MATIGIAGGTGFVGRRIARLLLDEGHGVIVFTRGAAKEANGMSFAHWNPGSSEIDTDALGRCDAILNLAGAGVADHRWTKAYKKEIRDSRVAASYFLHDQIRQHAPGCKTYVSASATGIYGPDRGGAPFTESDPPYNDFLGRVCKEWEEAASSGEDRMRTVILRFGIIMGRDGGAWPKFHAPLRLGFMPVLGSGRQIVPWIHLSDIAAICARALQDEHMQGVYNAVAPNPVPQRKVVKAMADARGRLAVPVPAPEFVLKVMMGESSIEVLKSTTVSAEKLLGAGFDFRFADITAAMEDLNRR